MIHEAEISCPYCGESFGVVVDTSAGDQSYVEDCYVCCRPIEFELLITGDEFVLNTRTDNE